MPQVREREGKEGHIPVRSWKHGPEQWSKYRIGYPGSHLRDELLRES